MLTKKHFIAIALILKQHRAKENVILAFAAYFKGENPRFDWDKFVNAASW